MWKENTPCCRELPAAGTEEASADNCHPGLKNKHWLWQTEMLFTWVSKNEQTRFGRGIAKAQAQDAPLPGVHDIQVQADSLWAAVRAPFHAAASAKQPRICGNEPQHNEFLHIHILLTSRVHPTCRCMPPKSKPLHDFALTITQNTAWVFWRGGSEGGGMMAPQEHSVFRNLRIITNCQWDWIHH